MKKRTKKTKKNCAYIAIYIRSSMKLKNVVPWGRNLQEYGEMGLYSDADRDKKILGCGDGPASVNAELAKIGVDIISIDPIYRFSKEQIQQRVKTTSVVVSEQLIKNRDDFVWKNIANVDKLITLRLQAMSVFLADYKAGKNIRRYRYEELPKLSFQDGEFDLAWSSHFIFLYSEHFDLVFHKKAVLEMLRVAKEVRIFPLLDLSNNKSPHLEPLLSFLRENRYNCEIRESDYEFQKGAFEMLKITQ
jgi:hypothetical protein